MQFTFDKRTVYETVFMKLIQQLGFESLLFCDIFKHFVHKTELYSTVTFPLQKVKRRKHHGINVIN